MIKIAFLQLLPSECVEENMEKGIHYCKEARKLGADIALFPEMCLRSRLILVESP